MTKKKRDYKAEYQRRIARGKAKGLSLSQSRGHPKAGEQYIRKSKPIDSERLQISLKALRSGKSLTDAAKEIHVSPTRLRNQAQQLGAIQKNNNRWTVKNTLPRQMQIYSEGEAHTVTVSKMEYASAIGRYMAGVRNFVSTNDIKHLNSFIGKSIKDIKNNNYPFETDPNTVHRLTQTGSETFEQIYKIII